MAEQGNTDGKVKLQGFFSSHESSQSQFKKLISACRDLDPTVTVLALQGLYDIENNVNSLHFQHDESDCLYVRQLLREWRNNWPFDYGSSAAYIQQRSIPTLRSLTIFREFDVPLFIDDYGKKEPLGLKTQSIEIDENTPIYHVTHLPEAINICEKKRLEPSDNKNMIAGTWFGIDDGPSFYGSRAFKTTLGKLGVQVLRQGEIVSYPKREVNVILYAGKTELDGTFNAEGLKKPKVNHPNYVKISIFVPSKFLPKTDHDFSKVFVGPMKVDHGHPATFCVKEKRSFGKFKCPADNLSDSFDNLSISNQSS
ncbi:uncharacterized protein LOC110241213 [Exaiptasia diaphana]|uniref:Uncharacterized protein n=1 Tax=Exaiptasia diaphana TaxID=2652724 RepID=A0A913XCW1_EXADI|nr:uncharacterized protein LOC110241213 [Exaiptasia diaphana]KXJ26418.1 hypothetical protein AC249_AIPGENE11560 [Exaiptasia diaphana]